MNISKWDRRRSWVLVFGLSLTVLTACTAIPDVPEEPTPDVASPTVPAESEPPEPIEEAPPLGDFEDFNSRYVDATRDLGSTLPEGVVFPDTPPGDWEPGGSYDQGMGDVTAALFWRCAWAIEYKNATDESVKRGALDRLETWIELPEVAPNTDQSMKDYWVPVVVQPARDGDTDALLQIADGCQIS